MQPIRRSSLFLFELMLAILLFSLAAAICVQVFVKSHTIKEKSTELNQAVLASVSVAEIVRSDQDFLAILTAEFPHAESCDGSLYIFYDQNWSAAASIDAVYTLRLDTESQEGLLTGIISVYPHEQSEQPIYELEIKKFTAKEDSSL